MRTTMDLFSVLCYIILVRLVSAKLAVKISKKPAAYATTSKNIIFPAGHFAALAAHPQPLPTDPPLQVRSSYTNIFQGLRHTNDTRVFRKKFEHEAMLKGQQIVCQGVFDCVISHIAIESSEAIPVLLRGGAGYRHFMAVIKAKPHHELRGQVRVYCSSNYVPLKDEDPKQPDKARRRFFFGDHLAEKNWS